VRVAARHPLLIVAALATAVLIAGMELAQADWWVCFHSTSSYEYRQTVVRTIVLTALTNASTETLVLLAITLPTLLAVALARRPGLQILALALLAVPVALILHSLLTRTGLHHCDRKGCTICALIGYWLLFIQLPLSSLLLVGLLTQRLFGALQRTQARAGS